MRSEGSATRPDVTNAALAELARCETLAQTSGWAARWGADVYGADGALLWAPDPLNPLFVCVGASGAGTERLLRRTAPRDAGLAHEIVRDRRATLLDAHEPRAAEDPLLAGLPSDLQARLAIPLEAEGQVVAILVLLFRERPDRDTAVSAPEGFIQQAVPALGRALRLERKTVGMLQAIERLTNLYDVSKAFGSTLDAEELHRLIVRKAVDLAVAEAASLWLLEPETADVILAATAVNENYELPAPPVAVGAALIGDVIADQKAVRRNEIPEGDPAADDGGFRVRSALAVPLAEDGSARGALVLANKRGRHPVFTAEDEELVQDLVRQAVRALRIARQHEAEKKVEELDALLAVSREITSTLDLDKVMQTIVNATSALITYDRCAIAILDRGRLRLGAVSGRPEFDRKDPDIARTEELLQWVYLSGQDVAVTQEEDDRLVVDRPETEEKFRAFFAASGVRSFYGVLLRDEEGKLGVLGFESSQPIVFDEDARDLLQILVNQATVAVRNAQLYQQVPLAGFWKPLMEKRRRLLDIPRRRRMVWALAAAATIVVLLLPWRLRISGPARVLPGRRAAVTAGVDGIVSSVLRREGDTVAPGDVIATMASEAYQAALADARAAFLIAESDVARHRESGDAAAVFEAQSRRDELAARIAMEEDRLQRATLRAPVGGVIVTPRLEERVGQSLARGDELCVIADVASITAEVAIPEEDVAVVQAGQRVDLKLNPYPTRTFEGQVRRVGARIREEGQDRFAIAEVSVANTDGALKTGMLGRAKVLAGHRRIGALLARKPGRYLYSRLWPLLP
ncbi:MAG TPA: GAF domain-containing protein [Vicinamibacteria bacterium]|nr:GAF domain-containing protein [Vicinamibacteria bacterium]